ncbi:hypothetical protein HY029_02835 [Candidatus Gottesmanbacteria bacterium]|nr:hypothetical protein [Candidatus Gottesmanbacteria bacterium]
MLLQEISKFISLPEDLIRCVFAIVLSVKLDISPPLWLMMVGMPSSAKTDLVSIFRKLDFVYFIDSMTMNPFASGYVPANKGKSYDLLSELNNKCFICKDYTTIFSLNEETTKKLLGEMVSIYDGEFAKYTPTRGYISYQSQFSHIGCITPVALNKHQKYLNIVGPRFMLYRLPPLDEKRRLDGFNIAWSVENRKKAISSCGELVKSYFENFLKMAPIHFVITNSETKSILEQLAVVMARTRGIILTSKGSFTNENGKQVSYVEITDKQVEEPWRAFQQLRNLGICLSILNGRSAISVDEIRILKNVVRSSMPAERADILDYFLNHSDVKAKDLSRITYKSVRTCQRILKELEGLEIITSDFQGEGFIKNYSLHPDFKVLMSEGSISIHPSEKLSRYLYYINLASLTDQEVLEAVDILKEKVVKNNLTLSSDLKNQYLNRAKIYEVEGKRRKIISDSIPNMEDQVAIEESLKDEVPF